MKRDRKTRLGTKMKGVHTKPREHVEHRLRYVLRNRSMKPSISASYFAARTKAIALDEC